ncbi:MAG: PDZ domain-containing protein [Acidimicrobiia bacterium]
MSACATAPPERSALPDVGEVLELPVACSFFIGEPQGVEVSEVVEDTAADGVLEAGDVIVALNGKATADSEHLRQALSEQSISAHSTCGRSVMRQ